MMSDSPSESDSNVDFDELVIRARTDRTAFGCLYERYYPQVSRYCLRRLCNRSVAEDVLSEVFLDVARHLPAFAGRTDADFRRWVFRIATNAINAHFRQSKRRNELFQAAQKDGTLEASTTTDSSASNDGLADWPMVFNAIMEFEERDRSIVMLRFFSECSHDEIADIVGSTSGAVRTTLSRLLGRLRDRFQRDEQSDQRRVTYPAG
jgi:RNA polymerase sigma-70 factor (ECF subfamily)